MNKHQFPFVTLTRTDEWTLPTINLVTEHQILSSTTNSEEQWLYLMEQITAAFNLCFRGEEGDKYIFITEESGSDK